MAADAIGDLRHEESQIGSRRSSCERQPYIGGHATAAGQERMQQRAAQTRDPPIAAFYIALYGEHFYT